MPNYTHDMTHCSQKRCKLKDKCYRYWLGKEINNYDYQYASYYLPQSKEDYDNCDYFLDLKEY